MKLVTTKFKSEGLHEKHVVATWNVGNHRSICLYTQGNREKPVSRWPVAGPSEYWLLASSSASKTTPWWWHSRNAETFRRLYICCVHISVHMRAIWWTVFNFAELKIFKLKLTWNCYCHFYMHKEMRSWWYGSSVKVVAHLVMQRSCYRSIIHLCQSTGV